MEERGAAAGGAPRHQLLLKARQYLSIEGVVNVQSFDDNELVLETDAGLLVIRGEGMHIQSLDVEKGMLTVEGYVRLIEYAADSAGKRAKGLMARLMR